MKASGEDYLLDEYSILFRNSCSNITCGDGWFDVVYYALEEIAQLSGMLFNPIVKVVQIKEDSGKLIIKLDKSSDDLDEVLRKAENSAKLVCEWCGSTEDISLTRGSFTLNLCPICMDLLDRDIDLSDRSRDMVELDDRVHEYTEMPE